MTNNLKINRFCTCLKQWNEYKLVYLEKLTIFDLKTFIKTEKTLKNN